MIRVAALVALAFACAGCASAPIDPPRIDVFSKAERKGLEMPAPAALPARPQGHEFDLEAFRAQLKDDLKHGRDAFEGAGGLLAFDKDGAARLIARDQVCVANTEIATHCAAGFTDLDRGYDQLLHQAQLLEQQHNYMAERWAQAEMELRQRERERAIETWLTRLLVAVALASAAD